MNNIYEDTERTLRIVINKKGKIAGDIIIGKQETEAIQTALKIAALLDTPEFRGLVDAGSRGL